MDATSPAILRVVEDVAAVVETPALAADTSLDALVRPTTVDVPALAPARLRDTEAVALVVLVPALAAAILRDAEGEALAVETLVDRPATLRVAFAVAEALEAPAMTDAASTVETGAYWESAFHSMAPTSRIPPCEPEPTTHATTSEVSGITDWSKVPVNKLPVVEDTVPSIGVASNAPEAFLSSTRIDASEPACFLAYTLTWPESRPTYSGPTGFERGARTSV